MLFALLNLQLALAEPVAAASPVPLGLETFSASPRRGFRYRGFSTGIGARLLSDFSGRPGYFAGTTVAPMIDVLAEFGWRRLRWVNWLYSSPFPFEQDDVLEIPIFAYGTGVLVGNQTIRGGAMLSIGAFTMAADAILIVAPWHSQSGGGHGLYASVGMTAMAFTANVGWRWWPQRINLRRQRK